jgi:RHS repeat-associated protein
MFIARRQADLVVADGSYTTSSYDNRGRQISTTDQMGRTTQYQYDVNSRLTAVVLPAVFDPLSGTTVNPTTKYEYDAYGNLTKITDARNRTTTFTFDQFNHQLTRTLPMGQQETTTYDAFGREATHTDFKGQKETFAYDSLGRVQEKDFYASGSNTAGETVVYHYDTLGRNDSVTDTIGTNVRVTSYTFDLDNRTTSITTPEGTINYGYDPATGEHTETSTANSDIQYGYDTLGRLTTVTVTKQNGVTLGTPLVANYFYTKVNTIDHVTYPNGTETDYTYDQLNRLTSVTNKHGTTVLSSYVYTLENDGLRTGVTEHELEADGSTSTVTKTWSYDALQRLTQEAVTVSGAVAYSSYTDTYTFDVVGNRLTKTDVSGGNTLVSSYTYNDSDELTAETGTLNGSSNYSTTYGYDTNGSLTSVSRTGAGAETDSYGYDLQNRLATANISRTEQGQAVVIAANYSYDDAGFRAQGVVTTTIGTGSPTTTTTKYLVDVMNPTGYTQVLEEHTNGSPTPSMSYLVGLSVFGQTDGGGVTKYLLTDGQGSTRLVADASGTVTARLGYDAYGNLLAVSVGVLNPPPSKILYTDQQFDSTLLRYYLRARIYNPAAGRFPEMDPNPGQRQIPHTLNRYLYAHADPLNFDDPSGAFEGLMGLLASLNIDSNLQSEDASSSQVVLARLAARTRVTRVYVIVRLAQLGRPLSLILHSTVFVENIQTKMGLAFDIGPREPGAAFRNLFGSVPGYLYVTRMSHADAMKGRLFSIPFAKLDIAQTVLFTRVLTIEANFVDAGIMMIGNVTGFPIQYGLLGGASRVLSCHVWAWTMGLEAMAISRIPI